MLMVASALDGGSGGDGPRGAAGGARGVLKVRRIPAVAPRVATAAGGGGDRCDDGARGDALGMLPRARAAADGAGGDPAARAVEGARASSSSSAASSSSCWHCGDRATCHWEEDESTAEAKALPRAIRSTIDRFPPVTLRVCRRAR